jgi:type IV pilus biogenesis protein CpaD/CtpE
MSFDSQPMKSRPSLLAAALFALAGCSQMPSTPQDPAPAAPPRDLPPIEYDGETLGDLLVAESAAQRQSLRVTMAYYARGGGNHPRPGNHRSGHQARHLSGRA